MEKEENKKKALSRGNKIQVSIDPLVVALNFEA